MTPVFVNAADALAFPLGLSFDTLTADFQMTPIGSTTPTANAPEPATATLLLLAATVMLRPRRSAGG